MLNVREQDQKKRKPEAVEKTKPRGGPSFRSPSGSAALTHLRRGYKGEGGPWHGVVVYRNFGEEDPGSNWGEAVAMSIVVVGAKKVGHCGSIAVIENLKICYSPPYPYRGV